MFFSRSEKRRARPLRKRSAGDQAKTSEIPFTSAPGEKSREEGGGRECMEKAKTIEEKINHYSEKQDSRDSRDEGHHA